MFHLAIHKAFIILFKTPFYPFEINKRTKKIYIFVIHFTETFPFVKHVF